MKQAYQSIASGERFYLTGEVGDEITLRSPETGQVKSIRRSTLKRSYTLLTEEDITMASKEQATVADEVVNAIAFEDLMGCETKADFEEKISAGSNVGAENFEDVEAIDNFADASKARNNSVLCFKENLDRFLRVKGEYETTQESLKANPADLDVIKACEVAKSALQKYANKMALYAAKAKAASVKVAAYKPLKEEKATADAAGATPAE